MPRFSPFSVKLRLVKAEVQLFLKRYPEASSVAADVLREDGNNAEALYIRGRALYYQSKFDQVHLLLASTCTDRCTGADALSQRAVPGSRRKQVPRGP